MISRISLASYTEMIIRSLATVVVLLAPTTAWESFLGHYRSGFALKAQYAPLATAALLTAAGVAALISPSRWGITLQIVGGLGILSGIIGAGYHHYYGIVDKPGGYRWLLHHLMYHAPPFAPLSHAALGAMLMLAGRLGQGSAAVFGIPVRLWIIYLCAITMTGAIAQSLILHYRGAFNNRLMYLPVTFPLLASVALIWYGLFPAPFTETFTVACLWVTFLIGFVGVGMHIRGVDRQMGGFYIGWANLWQGPPITAPLFFSGFSAAALAVIRWG